MVLVGVLTSALVRVAELVVAESVVWLRHRSWAVGSRRRAWRRRGRWVAAAWEAQAQEGAAAAARRGGMSGLALTAATQTKWLPALEVSGVVHS